VIERAVEIWSLPGELIFSPFAGIGSEGVGALNVNRQFLGFELKPSYYRMAVANLRKVEGAGQRGLFDESEESDEPDGWSEVIGIGAEYV
jgi:DNA modification methylase